MLAASFAYDAMNMPTSQQQLQGPNDVAEKVMRRVEIAKVARNLQDCLAFASFKAQHGWQDRTLRTIEPEVTEKLARRKRPYLEELPSDSSSSGSDDHSAASSHTFGYGQRSYNTSRKRVRATSNSDLKRPSNNLTWKQDHQLPQSSPVLDSRPTLEDSPMFDVRATSDDEDHDIPMSHMEQPSSSIISSSSPRTPPPTRRNQNSKHAGADLLLYLANSPRSPAVHVQHISSGTRDQPSTPPSQHAHLPSSVMQTPGNTFGLFNGALHTPGNFNLAEFCNVTPSPAQAQWNNRTPALSRTPGRLARRSLNFDTLVPPSPSEQHKAGHGLALQLGDELSRS